MRIALGLLEFLDGFPDFAGLKIKRAHLEADGEVGREPLDAALAFGNLKGQPLGVEVCQRLRMIRGGGIELFGLIVELLHAGFPDGAVEGGVASAGLGAFDPLVNFERAVELLFLGVEFGNRAQEFDVVRLGFEPGFIFLDEPLGHVLCFLNAVLLFERDGFLLVLQDVAIRALSAGQLLVAAFVEGFFRRQILEGLGQFAVLRVGAGEFGQDLFAAGGVADLSQCVGKLDGEVFVLG